MDYCFITVPLRVRENSLGRDLSGIFYYIYIFAKHNCPEMKIYWDSKALVHALAGCPTTHKENEWKIVLKKGIWKRSLWMCSWNFMKFKIFESHINTYQRAITKEKALIKPNRETETVIWHLPSSAIITMHTWMELPWWQKQRLCMSPNLMGSSHSLSLSQTLLLPNVQTTSHRD